MPVAKGARLDPDETRSRILRTASRLFYEHSAGTIGVSQIAAEARASKLSIYRSFPSKGDLAARVAEDRSDRVHSWLRRSTEDAGAAGALAVFDLLTDWYARPGYRGCAIVNAVVDARGGDNDDRIRQIGARHLERYRELLIERLSALGLGEARTRSLAAQLLLLVEGATAVAAIEGAASSAGDDARAAARALLDAASSGHRG